MGRWAWVMLACVGCLRPVSDPVDAGTEIPVDAGGTQQVAAADSGLEYDPCVWDGRGDGFCFADTAVVFDGTECRPVCGANPQLGLPGVFATEAQCHKTCPCNPEKFALWPQDGAAGPLAIGGHCDEVDALTDGGAIVPWPAQACFTHRLWGYQDDQSCLIDLHKEPNGYLGRRALSEACRASALPQVRQVLCVVWVD